MIDTFRIGNRCYMDAAKLAQRLGMKPGRLLDRLRRQPERWRPFWPDGGAAPAIPASRVGALLETLRPRNPETRQRVAEMLQEWCDQIDCFYIEDRRPGRKLKTSDYLRILQLTATGLGHDEVARQIGCSEGTVRVFLSGKLPVAAATAARDFFFAGNTGATPDIRLPSQTAVKQDVNGIHASNSPRHTQASKTAPAA